MHEMSLVRNIIEVVKEEAEAAQAAQITAVHLVVGEGRDIVEDLVQSLFRFLARGTVAENAAVILHHVPYNKLPPARHSTYHPFGLSCTGSRWPPGRDSSSHPGVYG